MANFEGYLIGDREKFLEDEEKASIFLLNGGCVYLKTKENSDKTVEKISKWAALMNISENDVKETREYLSSPGGEIARIIRNDVERCFAAKHNQDQLAKFLQKVQNRWSDYAQSMSYVAGIMMLALSEEETFSILCRINSESDYLPGHWKHQAEGYVTDAYVSWKFLSDEANGVSEVTKHLTELQIKPNLLFQKYMQGLSLHVLPLENAVEYIEQFLRHGVVFLYHFAICLFRWLKEPLLSLSSIDRVLALLRLERSELDKHELPYTPDHFFKLIEEASQMTLLGDIGNYKIDIPKLREKVFHEVVKGLLAPVEVSDEDSEDCMICKEGLRDFWCETCVKLICDECHENGVAPHDESHEVEDIDDLEDEDIDEKAERARLTAKKGKVDSLIPEMEALELS